MEIFGQDPEQVIEEEIKLLVDWVSDTTSGGWSTHLVKPMQKRIIQLKAYLFDYERRKK